jgi:hypothetical protein
MLLPCIEIIVGGKTLQENENLKRICLAAVLLRPKPARIRFRPHCSFGPFIILMAGDMGQMPEKNIGFLLQIDGELYRMNSPRSANAKGLARRTIAIHEFWVERAGRVSRCDSYIGR